MTELIYHSSVVQLLATLGKGQPHDEQILMQLQKYIDDRDYFLMSDETASIIADALAISPDAK